MKRQLIATLVASALELIAASAGAQAAAQCSIVGNAASANASTPVRIGPLNPVDGFPEYVTDSNGVTVQRCLDAAVCFFDPIVPTDAFSLQIGSGGEAFYWSADAAVSNAAGNRVLTLGMAAETAFLSNGPNGEPINGSQFPFLRLRFVMGVPVDGLYTVKHPYGTDTFTVSGATGARDVFSTVDRGFSPNSTATGSVGPFLKSASAPAGYMGDTNVADLVSGSPCGPTDAPWNFVEVSGVNTLGQPVDFGTGEFVLRTDLFNVQGKLYDGRVQTPLAPTRQTYSRTATGAAQIDSFAASTVGATVTVTDGPTIPAGSARIGAAQTLDRSAISATDAIDSLSVVVPAAGAATLPPIITLSAVDAAAAVPTDPTTLNLRLTDFVDIALADYDPVTKTLVVSASSSDQRLAPALTLRDFGAFVAGVPTRQITTLAPPAVVYVDSAGGGSASAQVRVITAGPSRAPTDLALVSATATTLTLRWSDNSTNEQGFKIYRVTTAAGVTTRTQIGSAAVNANSAVLTGLTPGQAYELQVDAFNGAAAQASTSLNASTLALPGAPSAVTPTLSTTTARAINIRWTDNAADETGFVISRSTTVGGTYTPVATAPAGATSAVDTSGANATTYFYKVAAQRGADSNNSLASSSVITPAAPTSAGTPTFTAASTTASSVKVNWTDRSLNETGFQVYRATVTGTVVGAYTAASGMLPANTLTFTDTGLSPSTVYKYRVDVSNWTGAVPSTASANVTTQALALQAPGTLTASNALAPVLSWFDLNSFETGYRVSARPITFSNAGLANTTAALTNLTATPLAANTVGYTDGRALAANALFQYSVSGLNGATVGTAATVYAVPGGIPAPTGLTATRPTAGNATAQSLVTLRWTTLAAIPAVGGYRVQRCNVTVGEDCGIASAAWTNAVTTPAAITGRTTATATSALPANTVGRTYLFRLIATTGTVVTGIESGPSATASVTR